MSAEEVLINHDTHFPNNTFIVLKTHGEFDDVSKKSCKKVEE